MSNANDFEIQGHLLKKYNGVEKKVLIPENVWEIASNAFCKNNDVEEIIVPSSVFVLNEHAFSRCENLSHVVLLGKIEKIKVEGNMYSCAFNNCPKLRTAGPIGGAYHVEFAWTQEIPGNAIPCVEKLVLPKELEQLHPNALLDFGPGEVDCEVICPGETFSLLPQEFKYGAAVRFLSGKDSPEEQQLKLLTAFIKKTKKKCMEKLVKAADWQAVGKLMEVCKEKADKVDEYIAQFSHEKYADLVDVLQRYKENCKLSGKKASHTKKKATANLSEKMEDDIREVFGQPEFITMDDPENNEVILLFCNNVPGKLEIPDGITYINEGVGFSKTTLKELCFPKSVRTVDFSCFVDCINLEKAIFSSAETKILEGSFENCPKLVIYAPAGSYAETYAKEHNIPFVAE